MARVRRGADLGAVPAMAVQQDDGGRVPPRRLHHQHLRRAARRPVLNSLQ